MKLNFLLILFLIIFYQLVEAGSLGQINGHYKCRGYDPFSNSHYQGDALITKTKDTYFFKWNFGKNLIYYGTGIADIATLNIAVVFVNPIKSAEKGVLLYHLNKDGSLTDTWTYFNKNKVGHGFCKKTIKH